ncbi:dienelactone hydrolase family protein [Phenylobacterium aquaticum]|uniref:dienelactone hydrolase family protein n=1 Tax=Phenylobacterium aquaticum TaxID=1763816 RepID=UPI001F5DB909|nr:dienelactone hydrolase family protein [Phenylobacterium aquaticum]MCI3131285.1 dienelactone hydrolase family protein [Phenylobacterium aquaticum]
MGDYSKLAGADGFQFTVYRAAPKGERKGGVVVIQEIFGIDEHIRRDVDRWAELGYEAIAPSLYDRREPGFTAGHDADGMTAGVTHARATPLDQALSDIDACRAAMAPAGKVFVVGYCYGGSLTWLAACQLDGFAAGSSYYGSMVQANADKTPKCPVIVHLGRKDAMIPADEVKAAVQAANPNVPVYIYEDAGHGFNNEDPQRLNQASADLARQRTLDLFAAA